MARLSWLESPTAERVKSLSFRYQNVLDSSDIYATLILYPVKGIGADR